MERLEIPHGNERADVEARRQIISKFYHDWKEANPSLRRYNISLKEFINIRFVSITETCTHAARSYFSTLAVLQLAAMVKMTVGVRRRTHEKVQYCITALRV